MTRRLSLAVSGGLESLVGELTRVSPARSVSLQSAASSSWANCVQVCVIWETGGSERTADAGYTTDLDDVTHPVGKDLSP